jgi:hypothetical protein
MFEGFGWKKKMQPGEKREVVTQDGQEAPVIIARDSLGNPISTAASSIDAEHKLTDNAEQWKEAA